MENIGAKIRELRGKKSLSIRELGNLADVHWNTIARIERGAHSSPRWETVAKILAALGKFNYPAENVA